MRVCMCIGRPSEGRECVTACVWCRVRIVFGVHEPRRRGIGMSHCGARRISPTIPTRARRPPPRPPCVNASPALLRAPATALPSRTH